MRFNSIEIYFNFSDIGTLEIFAKPDTVDNVADLNPLFALTESVGPDWIEHNITLPKQTEAFQAKIVKLIAFFRL